MKKPFFCTDFLSYVRFLCLSRPPREPEKGESDPSNTDSGFTNSENRIAEVSTPDMRALLIAQAVISLLLIVSILLQNRGSGLGSTFGGDFGGYYTKRGLEKFLLYATVVLAVLFFVIGALNVRLSSLS